VFRKKINPLISSPSCGLLFRKSQKMLYNMFPETFFFETHITVKLGKTPLARVIRRNDKFCCCVY